jgi:nicotinic acid mononucleotide adenylyltransferase
MNNIIDRIVVMGGSFNPPTVAHQVLMKAAMAAVDANLGYFVPVSDAYLRRKMRYTQNPMILSPELRIKMLNSMC